MSRESHARLKAKNHSDFSLTANPLVVQAPVPNILYRARFESYVSFNTFLRWLIYTLARLPPPPLTESTSNTHVIPNCHTDLDTIHITCLCRHFECSWMASVNPILIPLQWLNKLHIPWQNAQLIPVLLLAKHFTSKHRRTGPLRVFQVPECCVCQKLTGTALGQEKVAYNYMNEFQIFLL